ncbi:hypothetical protein TeGR_g12044 [Tetraparma gracilis]|jgi:tetratricopeptide (TPR) repeat protein|uniref:Tetratricopeptide repeat protein n=1 Tax=Tetraparma gracilis TaxID=2962635 RepID=A0ABQ6MEC9_9STRA|nr:hypothetical protein TeGR_g12044 [Tetraparma gracilis]
MNTAHQKALARHPTMSDQSMYNPLNDPMLPPFSQNLTWKDIGRRVEAREYWKDKIKQNRGNARYHHHLAPLRGEVKDTREEVKHHRLAAEYNPGDSNVLNDFALALYRQGKYDKAEVQLLQCLHVNPNHILALNNMAAVQCKKGKFSKAKEFCERAITLNPNDAMAHRNIAKILDTMGNTRDAVKHNRIAIQLGPGVHGVTQHADTMTYRNLARQLVARGQTESGHACAHYDAYRALSFKTNVLANSEKTKELLIRTKTKF